MPDETQERVERWGVRVSGHGPCFAMHEDQARIEMIAADLRQRMGRAEVFRLVELRPGERIIAGDEAAVERVARAIEDADVVSDDLTFPARAARLAITALLTPPHGSDT